MTFGLQALCRTLTCLSNRALVFGAIALLACLVGACSRDNDAEARRAAEANVRAQLPSEPATLPMQDATDAIGSASLPTGGATLPMAAAGFDVGSVPYTASTLPPFPFFKDPEGLENARKGPDAERSFDRHYFIAGTQVVAQEGRMALAQYNLGYPPSGRQYSLIEFQRNYENAIASLGGHKISMTQFTPEVVTSAGGREQVERSWFGAPPVPDAEHNTYLIRSPDKEYWIHVSAGGTIPLMGFVTVLEKQAMQSSLAFLDAAAMKKALDEQGRVALYINFDLDKASLRPDAQPIIEEINKLLAADRSLRLSIEGHTDSTGSAERNRELAAARARAVLGALVGLGVDAARLGSNGFGPDKPIADNSTDAGRARNRRVELVKTN